MKLLVLALLLSLAAVGFAAEPAEACTEPSVCSVLQDARCAMQDPTDARRALGACLGLLP